MDQKKHYTEAEILEIRDKMSVEELRNYTNAVKQKYGYVSFKLIFKEMGFEHSYNDKYKKIS